MNQSIRPLPFALPSENVAAEGALSLPSFTPAEEASTTEFDDLLDSELNEQPEQHKPDSEEPWTLFGYAAPPPPLLETPLILLTPVPFGVTQPVATAIDLNFIAASGAPGESLISPRPNTSQESTSPNAAQEALESAKSTDQVAPSLLEIVRPLQQKIPLAAPVPPPPPEQTAANRPESAKISSGTPAAQSPPMLSTSQKQEESAAKQASTLLETAFASESTDTKVEFQFPNSPKEPASKREFGLAELSPIASITPEWSSFDGIAEAPEIQAPKDIESLEVIQAIRSHVELLRTSGQGKLDVVLRPDGQTQLHLQVERINGQIFVQARCERGDFAHLESNWSAIQQSLATQGVRVEPLQQSASFQQNSNFNDSFSSAERHSNSRRESESAFIEQEFSLPQPSKKSAPRTETARGWQSWA